MECEKCPNEVRLSKVEEQLSKNAEDIKRNSETHAKFYENFEELRTANAVSNASKIERDKSIDDSLNFLKSEIGKIAGIIQEMQNRPLKQADSFKDKIMDKLITGGFVAIAGYIIYVLK